MNSFYSSVQNSYYGKELIKLCPPNSNAELCLLYVLYIYPSSMVHANIFSYVEVMCMWWYYVQVCIFVFWSGAQGLHWHEVCSAWSQGDVWLFCPLVRGPGPALAWGLLCLRPRWWVYCLKGYFFRGPMLLLKLIPQKTLNLKYCRKTKFKKINMQWIPVY